MGNLNPFGQAQGLGPHTHPEADIQDGALLARLAADESITGAWDFSQGRLRLTQGLEADRPSTGNSEGEVWWATDSDTLYVWDGAAWKAVGGDGIGSVEWTQGLTGEPASGSYADMRLEAGFVQNTGSGNIAVTFRQAFAQTPKLILGFRSSTTSTAAEVRAHTVNESATGFTLQIVSSGAAYTIGVPWLAIGR